MREYFLVQLYIKTFKRSSNYSSSHDISCFRCVQYAGGLTEQKSAALVRQNVARRGRDGEAQREHNTDGWQKVHDSSGASTLSSNRFSRDLVAILFEQWADGGNEFSMVPLDTRFFISGCLLILVSGFTALVCI